MPRVTHVKKARKDNPDHGIKKGDEYWWAGYRTGRSSYRRYWKVRPKPSQITASEFLAGVYSIQEDMAAAKPVDVNELQGMRDGWVEEITQIKDECEEKLNNMPEGLQQGDVGNLLQERADAMENWANELESIDLEVEDEDNPESPDIEDLINQLLEVDCGV